MTTLVLSILATLALAGAPDPVPAPAAVLQAPEPAPAPQFQVHVLTLGQGDELFARFGHIALVVDDPVQGSLVYNFGTFDFNDPDLRVRYLEGYLIYWLSVSRFEGTLQFYRHFDRQAVLQTLDLTPVQAAEVADRLRENARPENREYNYRHYLDNCSTRIRDLLDDVLGGRLRAQVEGDLTGRTYRDWTRQMLTGLPTVGNIIDYLLGPPVDKPLTRWEEYFLPQPFSLDLDQVRLADGRPLVRSRLVLLERHGPPVGQQVPAAEWLPLSILGGLLLLGLGLPLVLGRRRLARHLLGLGLTIWGLIAGLGGLVLLLMWTITQHTDTHANENLLITPLTHLWLLGPGLKLLLLGRLGGSARWAFWYLVGCTGLIGLDVVLKVGPFVQDNWWVIGLAVVIDVAALAGLWRAGLPIRKAPAAAGSSSG